MNPKYEIWKKTSQTVSLRMPLPQSCQTGRWWWWLCLLHQVQSPRTRWGQREDVAPPVFLLPCEGKESLLYFKRHPNMNLGMDVFLLRIGEHLLRRSRQDLER